MKQSALRVSIIILFVVLINGLIIKTQEVEELRTRNQMIENQFSDYKSNMDLLVQDLTKKMDKLKNDSETQLSTLNKRLSIIQDENNQLIDSNQKLNNENKKIKEERGIVYNIPLSPELQQYTFKQAKKYNISYELMLAVMYVESNYNSKLIHWNTNGTYDSGLMQINSCNKPWLTSELGITNFLDEKDNINAGCFYFGSLFNKYSNSDEQFILMAYNAGEFGAKTLNKKGIYSTNYSRKVLNAKQKILNKESLY